MNILKRYFLIITLLKEMHLTKQLKVNFKISAQFVKACWGKVRKMDGRRVWRKQSDDTQAWYVEH